MAKEARIKGSEKASSYVSEESVRMLAENSMALQKVVADLATDFKKISKDVSDLLELFNEAVKTISAEKAEEKVKEEEIMELKSKIDSLIDQNKTIARGIVLLESSLKPESGYSPKYSGSY